MRYLFIFIVFLLLTACSIRNDRKFAAAHPVKPDTIEDSTHFSGRIAKVVYPSNHLCNDSLTEYAFECLGSDLTIHVPCNYLRTDYFQYTEGEILTIHYPDASMISMLCGPMANLGIAEKDTNGRHDKKVIVKGYQFVYQNVPASRVSLFDKAFDLLNTDIK